MLDITILSFIAWTIFLVTWGVITAGRCGGEPVRVHIQVQLQVLNTEGKDIP